MSEKWFDRLLGAMALLMVVLWALHMDRVL